jgi:subtilase family serine protease
VFKIKSIGAAALGLATATLGLGTVAPTAVSAADAPTISPQIVMAKHVSLAQIGDEAVPTYSQCRGAGVYCYTPSEMRSAYSVGKLLRAHHEGKGETIVIVDAYGSPTIAKDLKAFDRAFHLPNPTLKIHKFGKITYNQHRPTVQSWEGETSLDVQWAHAMAPEAKIDLLISAGTSKFFSMEQYAYNHHLGKILSQSWGSAANTLNATASGRRLLRSWNTLYAKMGSHGWTVLASAGDHGTDNGYSTPTVLYPAASADVTGVGGTTLVASKSGKWERESVWNDNRNGEGAGGGGVSPFGEPVYQRDHVKGYEAKVLRDRRGVPDISWNANPETGVWVRCTATKACQNIDGFPGWLLVGGTSAGAPQLGGYIADVDQAIGHGIGPVNPILYRLGSRREGYHDITKGSNGYGGVRGYDARRGWDAASGWGTPAGRLSGALIAAGKH